jgi:hypothetical protein
MDGSFDIRPGGGWYKAEYVDPVIEQLRGNLSLAEEGLASATQEIEELRAAGKILVDEGDRHLAEYNAEIEQHKRNLAWQSKEIDAQVTEIQLLRDQRDSNLAKEVETVQRLNAEIERLRQARLTWAMACHCACQACDTFFNVFRANAPEASIVEAFARSPRRVDPPVMQSQHPAPCWCPYCGEPHSPAVRETAEKSSEVLGAHRRCLICGKPRGEHDEKQLAECEAAL